jgi:hypothetical protein
MAPWMSDHRKSGICDAIVDMSNFNTCSKCARTICFQCWWSEITKGFSHNRAQYACLMCWETVFGISLFPIAFGHRAWRLAQIECDFCKGGSAIICMYCTRKSEDS